MSKEFGRYTELLELVKKLLTLSHGQAAVERGFSVNKEVEVENMKHQTVIAQRLICDHIRSVGGIQNVDLNKDLLLSIKGARQKYEAYLEKAREKERSAIEIGKRKHMLEVISELNKKKNWNKRCRI